MLRVVVLAGQAMGRQTLETLAALGAEIRHVVASDAETWAHAGSRGWPRSSTVHAPDVRTALTGADVLVCVHGREIVPEDLLALLVHGGLNVHPCLWRYPGADPVGRWLQSGETWTSVGAHRMTAEVDRGPRIYEEAVKITDRTDRATVYRQLAPVYDSVLRVALNRVCVWETVESQC